MKTSQHINVAKTHRRVKPATLSALFISVKIKTAGFLHFNRTSWTVLQSFLQISSLHVMNFLWHGLTGGNCHPFRNGTKQ